MIVPISSPFNLDMW